jgi:hypothetical protein
VKINCVQDLADLPRPLQLQGADFRNADLEGADLSGADLFRAIFTWANLQKANLEGADLSGASLWGVDLRGARLPPLKVQLAPEGEVETGWKKVLGGFVLELEIPADSPRTATLVGLKCRAEKAKVLRAFDKNGNEVFAGVFRSLYDGNFTYRIGQTAHVRDYSSSVSVECTSGVHFFKDRKLAEEFVLR